MLEGELEEKRDEELLQISKKIWKFKKEFNDPESHGLLCTSLDSHSQLLRTEKWRIRK